MLMRALMELNGLPTTVAQMNSLVELDDVKLSTALTVIKWYITTYSSNIYPSLPKIK